MKKANKHSRIINRGIDTIQDLEKQVASLKDLLSNTEMENTILRCRAPDPALTIVGTIHLEGLTITFSDASDFREVAGHLAESIAAYGYGGGSMERNMPEECKL
ncbi:hypothetical protein ACELLULO517_15635 [Acidisoma cellulosilytica]|uniref:Uncharacterized protein n=1 Tax=Acidisoma cellulosilyticum TaxID=2802395 RepID=A0A963Z384_9PROT|nr:hypothetical protein [Acidisoma cellulosilyticum]MCB8881679.1 hypothetical protein [Acidisoma cellulosilyticum]